MIEYLDNEIAFLTEKVNTSQAGSQTNETAKVERDILVTHRARYIAWLSRNKIKLFPGSVVIVENTMEYLRGFRDGVLKVKS